MSYLVANPENPENRFSRDEAQISVPLKPAGLLNKCWNGRICLLIGKIECISFAVISSGQQPGSKLPHDLRKKIRLWSGCTDETLLLLIPPVCRW